MKFTLIRVKMRVRESKGALLRAEVKKGVKGVKFKVWVNGCDYFGPVTSSLQKLHLQRLP